MAAAGVPTAALLDVPRAPCVVKADGLAAGKGVLVCRTNVELEAGLDTARDFQGPVLVEELLEGSEVSVFAVCDGARARAARPARDFKRAYDGDEGPNTGGMGSFAPVPGIDGHALSGLLETCIQPVLDELALRGTPFVGTLFAGLMLTADGPRVLEYNCRFGDPETQSVLPLVAGDLLGALAAAASGSLDGVSSRSRRRGCCHRRARRGRLPRGIRPRDADRGRPPTPKPRARSSSRPAPPSTRGGSSRTAVACWASRRRDRRSPRHEVARTPLPT